MALVQPDKSVWEVNDGFRVLDHQIRRLILGLLHENGPMEYKKIASLLQAKSKNISYHLLVLRPYVVKNEDGLFELNELGKHLATFLSNGKRMLNEQEKRSLV